MLPASYGLSGSAIDLLASSILWPRTFTGVLRRVATKVCTKAVTKQSQQYIKLLVAYLTTLSVTQFVQRPIVGGQ